MKRIVTIFTKMLEDSTKKHKCRNYAVASGYKADEIKENDT